MVDHRTEIEQAVAAERQAYEGAEAVQPEPIRAEEPRGYFDQLRIDLEDNHLGDARRFANKFDGRLIFDNIQGRWHVHNCTHWEEDKGRRHLLMVTDIARDYASQVAYCDREIAKMQASEEFREKTKVVQNEMLKPWLQQRRAWQTRARELKDPARIKKVLDMASVVTPGFLGIMGSEWNPDPYLMACGDFVIDLRTGAALDPDPRNYINRASTVEWRGLNQECELWDTFLDQIFNGDEELKCYAQKCVGYWLTGLMTHQEFYCLWGPQGRNGKGVFFRTIRKVMGTYFQTIPSKFLLDEKTLQNTDKPDQILITMEHSRLVCASESPKRAKFSEGAIKQLSGGDPITCRGMWASHITEYIPKFKMLFATNRVPSVSGDDGAFKDRLRIIKFPCTFKMGVEPDPKLKIYPRDPQLEDKLHTPENLSGILAWAVRGAVEFIRTMDLTPPASVLADTAEYMEQNDFIGEFIRDCLVVTSATENKAAADEKTQMKEIYRAFIRWCKEEKSIPESKIWSNKAVGNDFRDRSELFKVPPKNKTFYNVRIIEDWLPEEEQPAQGQMSW